MTKVCFFAIKSVPTTENKQHFFNKQSSRKEYLQTRLAYETHFLSFPLTLGLFLQT